LVKKFGELHLAFLKQLLLNSSDKVQLITKVQSGIKVPLKTRGEIFMTIIIFYY